MNQELRPHLLNLLYEQYKIDVLYDDFDSIGIEMNRLDMNIKNIVYDLMGFPPEDDEFCRDWLYDEYHSVSQSLLELNLIPAGYYTPKQRKLSPGHIEAARPRIMQALSSYIDWLYEELEKAQLP